MPTATHTTTVLQLGDAALMLKEAVWQVANEKERLEKARAMQAK